MMNKDKTENRKKALKEWKKYVDTLTVDEAKELTKEISEYIKQRKK